MKPAERGLPATVPRIGIDGVSGAGAVPAHFAPAYRLLA